MERGGDSERLADLDERAGDACERLGEPCKRVRPERGDALSRARRLEAG